MIQKIKNFQSPKNKKFPSQQTKGYFLSLKLGRRTNYRSKLGSIAPSLSNQLKKRKDFYDV